MCLRASSRARSVFDVDYSLLKRQGIRALLFDLDRTLGPGKPSTLPSETTALLQQLLDERFRIAIVSNRRWGFDDFTLDPALRERILVRFRAGKPRPWTLKRVLNALGASRKEAVMIGDLWVTDGLAARTAGMLAILLRPWKDDGRPGA